MTFRFYITDLCDGTVKGTNNSKVARDFANSDDHFVVDTVDGTQWVGTRGKVSIKEFKGASE